MKTRFEFVSKQGVLGALLCGAVLSVGCGGSAVGDPPVGDDVGDDDVGPSDPDDNDDDVVTPRDASGTYALDSQFDVASGIPGDVGNVVNTILDMTDDPYDPATWVLDQIDNDTINTFRPVIEPVLYDLIQNQAPNLVLDLLEMADHLGDVTRQCGIVSELQVTGDIDAGYTAVHTITGFAFEIDGQRTDFYLAELGAEDVVINGVAIDYDADGARLAIGSHDIALPYGGMLALALEDVIIPLIDPNAYSLHDLLQNAIDCTEFGYQVADALGFGSPATYESACETGLAAASDYAMDQVLNIDEVAPVVFQVEGEAIAKDRDRDRMVDQLTRGKWNGLIDYAGSQAALSADDEVNVFTGQRMN